MQERTRSAIFDTSALVAILDKSHENHHAAAAACAPHRFWHVPAGVVAELTQVLRRFATRTGQDGNAITRRALDALESAAAYRYLAEHDGALVARIYQTHTAVSYVDAWVIALAYDRVEPLVSFDERQSAVLERLR